MAQPSLFTGGLGFQNWAPGVLLAFGLGSFQADPSAQFRKISSTQHSLYVSIGVAPILTTPPRGQDVFLRSLISVEASMLT